MRVGKDINIGRLAAETGCTVATIRYYEEIGLLPRALRNSGRQRIYATADLQRLTFIRRCRDFGFSIERIKELVALASNPERDCIAARDLARDHLHLVRGKLKELRALERTMKQFVVDCERQCAGGPAGACVILHELTAPLDAAGRKSPRKKTTAKPGSCCAALSMTSD